MITEKMLLLGAVPLLVLTLLLGLIVVKSRGGRTTTLSLTGLGVSIQFRSSDSSHEDRIDDKEFENGEKSS